MHPTPFDGTPNTLTTLLRGYGIEQLFCGRGVPEETVPYYWREGPDGSRMLAYNPVYGDSADLGPCVLEATERWQARTGDNSMLFLYGCGDRDGGPLVPAGWTD